MWKPENYRFGLDLRGLGRFVMIMLPNLLWMAIPAPHDILRGGTLTPLLDHSVSVVQALMLASLCLLINRKAHPSVEQKSMLGICVSVMTYLFGWIFYYIGMTGLPVILILAIAPCLSFLFYVFSRKNGPALLFTLAFMTLHTLQAVLNYT